jgi:hypothetical protein
MTNSVCCCHLVLQSCRHTLINLPRLSEAAAVDIAAAAVDIAAANRSKQLKVQLLDNFRGTT